MGGPSSRRLARLEGDPIRAFIESMTTGSNSNFDSANWPHLLGVWPTSALPREEEVGDHYGKFFILELGHLAVNYHCSRSVTVCCSLHIRCCPIACVCEARQDARPSYCIIALLCQFLPYDANRCIMFSHSDWHDSDSSSIPIAEVERGARARTRRFPTDWPIFFSYKRRKNDIPSSPSIARSRLFCWKDGSAKSPPSLPDVQHLILRDAEGRGERRRRVVDPPPWERRHYPIFADRRHP